MGRIQVSFFAVLFTTFSGTLVLSATRELMRTIAR